MRRNRGRAERLRLLLAAAGGLAPCAAAAGQFPHFTDVTAAANLGGHLYTSTTQHALGVNWIDFNADGWPDLFAVNGFGNTAHLYFNNGNGTFTAADFLLPPLPDCEMMGSVFADYDNDGDSDLYIFTDHQVLLLSSDDNPSDGPLNLLLRNLWVENGNAMIPGQPLFIDVAGPAGVAELVVPPLGLTYPGRRATSGCWLDANRDGFVDLFVAHWACQHPGGAGNEDRMYFNNGDGTFTDVTATSGLHLYGGPVAVRPSLCAIGAHLDQNLWPDLYVGNVQDPAPLHFDFLYRNAGDGTFTDATGLSPGIGDDAAAAMGIAVADIELDGDWDVYISDIYDPGADAPPVGNPLYRNNGNGTFTDNTADLAGVQGTHSWGVNFIDADQDGYEDLFLATMSGLSDILYRNNGNGTFMNVSAFAGMQAGGDSRGSALADYDGDGDQDIAVVNHGGMLRLYRNDSFSPGHWLQVRLRGTESNRDAIGALAVVVSGGHKMMRQVLGGSSAHSQDSLVLHFGLGSNPSTESLEIFWPSGAVSSLSNVAGNQLVEIVEEPCPADINGDGAVNVQDLLMLLAHYGQAGGPSDIDGDGAVNVSDLLALLAALGPC